MRNTQHWRHVTYNTLKSGLAEYGISCLKAPLWACTVETRQRILHLQPFAESRSRQNDIALFVASMYISVFLVKSSSDSQILEFSEIQLVHFEVSSSLVWSHAEVTSCHARSLAMDLPSGSRYSCTVSQGWRVDEKATVILRIMSALSCIHYPPHGNWLFFCHGPTWHKHI